jgi:streptomycin 6-kinase
MLLLEHLRPGTMLCGHADDEAQTLIAAELMQKLWRNVPPEPGPFLLLSSWFEQLEGLRSRFGGGTGPYPEKTIAVVEGMIKELFAEDRPQVLLHGDYHHFNILLSDHGWLAIDPKGVIGAPEYESGPLLMNPWGHMPDVTEAIRRSERRIAILSERLGLDRQRLLRWAICHSLLSSYWDVQEDGSGGEYSFAWTEIFLRLKIK